MPVGAGKSWHKTESSYCVPNPVSSSIGRLDSFLLSGL